MPADSGFGLDLAEGFGTAVQDPISSRAYRRNEQHGISARWKTR